jgi:hypothetical protein
MQLIIIRYNSHQKLTADGIHRAKRLSAAGNFADVNDSIAVVYCNGLAVAVIGVAPAGINLDEFCSEVTTSVLRYRKQAEKTKRGGDYMAKSC